MNIIKTRKKKRIRTKEVRNELKADIMKERNRANKKYVKLDMLDQKLIESDIKTEGHIQKLDAVADSMNSFVATMAEGGIRTDFMKENAKLIKDVFFDAVKRYEDEQKAGSETEGGETSQDGGSAQEKKDKEDK